MKPPSDSPGTPSLRLGLATLYGGELCAKLLGLLAFAWLGHRLGQERYGDLEFALGVLFLLNLVMEAGLGPYGAREAAQDPSRTERLAARIGAIRAGILVLDLVLLGALAAVLERDDTARAVLLLYGLVLVPAPLVLNWAFQARGAMGVVAGASLLRQAVLCGGVLLLVREPEHAVRVPLVEASGFLAAVALQQVLFRRTGARFAPWRGWRGAGRVLRESLPLAASSVAWALRLFFPLIALGLFVDSAATGRFGAGHRLVVALHTFVWLYFFNLLPAISRAAVGRGARTPEGELRRSLDGVAWLVLPGCLLATCLAPLLLPAVYGPDFRASAAPFQVLVWMLAAAFLSGHHRYALIAWGHQRAEFGASAAGAVVSVLACCAAGPRLTPDLAAGALLAGELTTLAAARLQLARRVGKLSLAPSLARPAAVAAVAAALAFGALPGRPLLQAAAVVAVAAAGLALLRPAWMRWPAR